MARAKFKKGAKIERFERNLDRPGAALKQVGAILTAESQRAFKAQRLGKDRWPPRGAVNVFGIIADFAQGKKAPPARRFQRRPALRDTGRLAGSISFRIVSKETVEVGSRLPYAGVHHHGGAVRSEPVTAQVQRLLWRWLKGRGAALKNQLGWLLNRKFRGQRIEGEVPRRPIVGVTRTAIRDVQRAVGQKIFEVR